MYQILIDLLIAGAFSTLCAFLIQWVVNATDGYAKYERLVEKNQMEQLLGKYHFMADEMTKEFKSYDEEVQKFIK